MTEEGSNVTMCESGEEQKCGQGDPCRLSDSRTHFQLKPTTLATINQMQNTVLQDDMKDEEDERDDMKHEEGADDVEDEGDDKEKDDEEENKLHTTPNSTLVQFGAAPQDGARIGRQLQISATLDNIYICTLS